MTYLYRISPNLENHIRCTMTYAIISPAKTDRKQWYASTLSRHPFANWENDFISQLEFSLAAISPSFFAMQNMSAQPRRWMILLLIVFAYISLYFSTANSATMCRPSFHGDASQMPLSISLLSAFGRYCTRFAVALPFGHTLPPEDSYEQRIR